MSELEQFYEHYRAQYPQDNLPPFSEADEESKRVFENSGSFAYWKLHQEGKRFGEALASSFNRAIDWLYGQR